MATLGTGLPYHKILRKYNHEETILNTNDKVTKDLHGFSTLLTGMLVANLEKTIRGICPQTTILHAKISDKKGNIDYRSITAGILWALVKKTNIIIVPVLPLEKQQDLIKATVKADRMNSILISYCSSQQLGLTDIYHKVLFITSPFKRFKTNDNISKLKNNCLSVRVAHKKMTSTYLDNSYTKLPSYIESLGWLSGSFALYLSNYFKSNTRRTSPFKIVTELIKRSK
jgi:hypothetical protein